MIGTQPVQGRCTLCPAGCELHVAPSGPDTWRGEPPRTCGQGLCPRGSALVELLTHRNRILSPFRRVDGQAHAADLASALRAILNAARGKELVLLMDGNVPWEEMTAAAGRCRAWPQARLCLVIEPADEQLLLGTEAGGAEYLSSVQLADCDGFLVVGDVFSANPACARGIHDCRKAKPRAPVVVIDPAAGIASKFATHRVDVAPGMELAAVLSVAAQAGIKLEGLTATPRQEVPPAAPAGQAIVDCKRLGVVIAADYGRCDDWRQIGYAAGRIAKSLGGGVAPQTVGANALAAVRLAKKLETISLAEAMSPGQVVRVAIGCDVLGMLGWRNGDVFAAASPLPSCTTGAAQVVLPVAMTGELGGTYLLDGGSASEVAALLPLPAGVLTPAGIVAALADEAGARKTGHLEDAPLPERIDPGAGVAGASPGVPEAPVLLIARKAMHSGCGSLTRHASWPSAIQSLPELRVAPPDARQMGLKNLDVAAVAAGGGSVRARVRLSPELSCGRYVLSDGFPAARALVPSVINLKEGVVAATPAAARVDV